MKTLVLGIGNDILGDDGVGIHIAREVARWVNDTDTEVKETGAAGLNLLELVKGYERLIIADAILTDNTVSGRIHRLTLEALDDTNRMVTPHGASLRATLEIGNRLFPGEMPGEVVLYTVQTTNPEYVTDEMTGAVGAAVPEAVRLIMDEITAGHKTIPLSY
jgi:hydrogenase maturation protease